MPYKFGPETFEQLNTKLIYADRLGVQLMTALGVIEEVLKNEIDWPPELGLTLVKTKEAHYLDLLALGSTLNQHFRQHEVEFNEASAKMRGVFESVATEGIEQGQQLVEEREKVERLFVRSQERIEAFKQQQAEITRLQQAAREYERQQSSLKAELAFLKKSHKGNVPRREDRQLPTFTQWLEDWVKSATDRQSPTIVGQRKRLLARIKTGGPELDAKGFDATECSPCKEYCKYLADNLYQKKDVDNALKQDGYKGLFRLVAVRIHPDKREDGNGELFRQFNFCRERGCF